MKPTRIQFAWLCLLLPPALAAWQGAETPRTVAALAAALGAVGLMAWAHRPQPSDVGRRLAKEVQGIALPAAVAMVLPPLLTAAPDPTTGPLTFALVISFLAASAIGGEVEAHTLETWISQPLPRAQLIAEKMAPVAAVMGLALVELFSVGPKLGSPELAVVACAVSLGVAPLLVLLSNNALLGALMPVALTTPLVAVLRPFDGSPALITLVLGVPPLPSWILVALSAGVGTAALHRIITERPERSQLLSGPRRSLRLGALGLRSQVAKELRLQLPAMLVGSLGIAGWAVLNLFHNNEARGVLLNLPWFIGLMVAVVSGICAVGSERRFGTDQWDLANAPSSRVWRTKLATAASVAVVFGVAIPSFLTSIRPGIEWASVDRPMSVDASNAVAPWVVMVLTLVALGMLVSGLMRDLSRAFLATLAAGLALSCLALVARLIGDLSESWYIETGTMSTTSVGPGAEWLLLGTPLSASHRVIRSSLRWLSHLSLGPQGTDAAISGLWFLLAGAVGWVLLAAGRQAWMHGRVARPWRSIGALGSIALVVLVAQTVVSTAWAASILQAYFKM